MRCICQHVCRVVQCKQDMHKQHNKMIMPCKRKNIIPYIIILYLQALLPMLFSPLPTTLAFYKTVPTRSPGIQFPLVLHRLRDIVQGKPKLRRQRNRPFLRNRNTVFQHQFNSFMHQLTKHSSFKKERPGKERSFTKYPQTNKWTDGNKEPNSQRTPLHSNTSVSFKSNNINPDPQQLVEYTVDENEISKYPMADKQSPIHHSREIFSSVINTVPIGVLSGTFSEGDKPVAPQNILQPISSPNYGTKYYETNPTSSLPTYSPEIYIKDQPPLIYKGIPHNQSSIEYLPTDIFTDDEQVIPQTPVLAATEKTQTNSKQPIQTFYNTFLAFSILSEKLKTQNLRTYDVSNPTYRPDTNIQSEIETNNNFQETSINC
jgi:hypothetical protein